jgi:hypothetical protein
MIDRMTFYRWLLGKEPGEVVGRGQRADVCPIATFLREACGYTTVRVWADRFFGERSDGSVDRDRDIDPVLGDFVRTIDGHFRYAQAITARSAVEILERLMVLSEASDAGHGNRPA